MAFLAHDLDTTRVMEEGFAAPSRLAAEAEEALGGLMAPALVASGRARAAAEASARLREGAS